MGTEILEAEVFSVHAAQKIGIVNGILVRNKDLKIELLKVKTEDSDAPHYLMTNDIRAYDQKKIIVNSMQELSQADELIRHQEFIKSANQLFGLKVVTQSGKKIGKVKDFTIDTAHYFVVKIHITAGLWQRVIHERLIIDRSDIVDVKSNKLIVRDSTIKAKAATKVLPAKV